MKSYNEEKEPKLYLEVKIESEYRCCTVPVHCAFLSLSVPYWALMDIRVENLIVNENENLSTTSLPYFGVKLRSVCLMFAYRKNSLKLP